MHVAAIDLIPLGAIAQRHSVVRSALALLLRPLARMLLRQGITAHEFTAVANASFVDAAEDVLKEQGKEPNFSRISSLTGLHRHAVSDVANTRSAATGERPAQKHYQRNRLARVLAGWFESPDFTDRDGRPRLLPFDGPHPSFTSLVKKFSGDIYPRIILDELLRVKAARMTRDGMVRAVSRRFSTGGADPDACRSRPAWPRRAKDDRDWMRRRGAPPSM